jgi:hypothetical protein
MSWPSSPAFSSSVDLATGLVSRAAAMGGKIRG